MEAIFLTGTDLRSVSSSGSSFWRRIPTTTTSGVECSASRPVSVRAASNNRTAVIEFESGVDEKPNWTGDGLLAKFVSQIISIKPVYEVLKIGAKRVMVRTAEQNGIAWKKMVEEMEASNVFAEKEKLENTAIVYPDYYTRPFHAYEAGNLSWEAAFDVEPATMALWKRTFPNVQSWQEAGKMSRGKWVEAIQSHHAEFSSGLHVREILDLGCSTADSTRFLARHYNTAQVTGLDLSPYFLAVAQHIEKRDCATVASGRKSLRFVHANAENTDLPSKSFDIVSIAYVLHECPRDASKNILKEARRLVKPGGTVALTDLSPKSKILQELHPALFTMMKSTEPWLDEFILLDLEAELQNCGFTNVRSILTDPRHFTCKVSVELQPFSRSIFRFQHIRSRVSVANDNHVGVSTFLGSSKKTSLGNFCPLYQILCTKRPLSQV